MHTLTVHTLFGSHTHTHTHTHTPLNPQSVRTRTSSGIPALSEEHPPTSTRPHYARSSVGAKVSAMSQPQPNTLGSGKLFQRSSAGACMMDGKQGKSHLMPSKLPRWECEVGCVPHKTQQAGVRPTQNTAHWGVSHTNYSRLGCVPNKTQQTGVCPTQNTAGCGVTHTMLQCVHTHIHARIHTLPCTHTQQAPEAAGRAQRH